MEAAIAIWEKHFAADHPTLATSYHNLAGIDFSMGSRDVACAGWRRALVILLKHFPEEHPHVQTVRAWMRHAGCEEAP